MVITNVFVTHTMYFKTMNHITLTLQLHKTEMKLFSSCVLVTTGLLSAGYYINSLSATT